jgi:hypothetical protein
MFYFSEDVWSSAHTSITKCLMKVTVIKVFILKVDAVLLYDQLFDKESGFHTWIGSFF